MELARRTWGEGSARALLVHGLNSSSAGWWRLGPALGALGYSVTAPDLRGHGASGKADSYRIEQYAQDLLELDTSFDVVIGHSLGGAAAIVAQDQEPSWATRMILLDPALWMASDPEAEAALTSAFRTPATRGALMEANPTWHPEDARFKAEALAQTTLEVSVETFRQNQPWNVVPHLMRISVPILLVGADPDRGALVPRSLGESLASLSASLHFTWVRFGSHSMHRDEYEQTLAVVCEWLG